MTSALKLPPGSLGLPFLGETLQWVSDPFRFCEERFRAHGPVFKTRILGDPVVCCTGPEAFTRFVDPEYFTRDAGSPPHVEALVGAGTLPFVEGPGQRRNKRLLLSAFQPEPMRGYVRAVTPIVDRYLARWEHKGEFLWYPDLEWLTLQLFDTLFAGAPADKEDPALKRDLEVFLRGIMALPLPLPWGAYQRALRARDRLLHYLGGVIKQRRQAPQGDAASHILAARDEAGGGFSDKEATAEMLHILFAGYGVMASNLGYAVIALAQNEAVRESARAEVLERTSEQPTLDELLRLDYVGQVWKELLRFYPAVPHTFLARVVRPVEIGGFQVPAGWRAMGVIRPSLQDERLFAEPRRFDPDRFGPGRAEDQRAPNTFVAQGGGPPEGHRCLGESVSAVVMKLFLARLLRGHTWELRDTPSIDMSFPVAPRGGVPVRFKRR